MRTQKETSIHSDSGNPNNQNGGSSWGTTKIPPGYKNGVNWWYSLQSNIWVTVTLTYGSKRNSFKLADALGIESFPMTLVVDASGKVLKIQDGFKEGSGSTEALFEALRKNAAK